MTGHPPALLLHGTVSLQDTHGRWVEIGTAARTVVRGKTVDRLHMLARIFAQSEAYRLEIRSEAEPDARPFDTQYGPPLAPGQIPALVDSRRPIPVPRVRPTAGPRTGFVGD
jgi:hypothetical protein